MHSTQFSCGKAPPTLFSLPVWPFRKSLRQAAQKRAQRRKTAWGFLLIGCLTACCWLGLPLRADPTPKPRILNAPAEIRGVWITNVASSVLFAPWGISRAVHQLADLQFNTLYPVVWNRGKAFYPSSALEKLTGQAIAPFFHLMHLGQDPLQEMVELSHQHKMKILPWFEYGFMVPLDSALARQHPDWLTAKQNGTQATATDTFTPETELPSKGLLSKLLDSGAPSKIVWLNPMHPAVQGLLLEMVEEVIAHYDVDGIQFDDHFSLPVEYGYDPYTVALYQAEHAGQSPPDNPADEDWIRWRAGKISRFVEILHARIKAKCPTCQLSLSPNPAKFAYRFYLQDWRLWVREGWIDDLVVQVYRDDLEKFDSELDKQALKAASDRIPVSIAILTGTWQKPIPFEQIEQQVTRSRDRQFAGISFFYWDTLWSYFTPESPQQRRQNFKTLLQQTRPLISQTATFRSPASNQTIQAIQTIQGSSHVSSPISP